MHGESHEQLQLRLRSPPLRRTGRDWASRHRQWRARRDHGRPRPLHRRHPRQRPEEAHPQLPPDLQKMQYGEMAERLPLKRYQVLVAGWDWWDITNRTIVDVFASTPSQAKYKAYERCEYHDIECMFGFKVRRA